MNNDHDLYRADCIANLKRSINHRLQAIERIYKISKLPLDISAKKALDRYEYLGLIRPMLLSELIKVRNVIEHQDKIPPPKKKCIYYIDIVWYFLKSTDALVDDIVTEFECSDDEKNVIIINVDIKESWRFNASLNIASSLLSFDAKSGYIELQNEVLVDDSGRVKETVELKPNTHQQLTLINDYFSSANYWHEDRLTRD